MPNTIAYLALLGWPVVCLFLFLRLPFERAIVWSILGGYLLLPERTAFDAPLVPPLDKDVIPALAVFLICLFWMGRRVSLWPVSPTGRVLMALFVFGVIPTVLTNGETLVFDDTVLPALSGHDLLSVVVNQFLFLLPFLIARQHLASETGLRELLLGLAVGGLVYSLPALFEVRMSPQLHTWVYGFFQHRFDQMMRGDGFRPIVFLPHALWLAMFFVAALLASATMLRRTDGVERVRWLAATLYLAGVLVLSKSLASQLYALAFTPFLLFSGSRTQIRVALLLAVVATCYPVLRNAGLVPVDMILEKARAIDPTRASSLGFRLNNENLLLDRAWEKPLFGWGTFGRNLVYDPETGRLLTIPDGRWIIVFGTFGWVGYIAEMGLLALPVLLAARAGRVAGQRVALHWIAPAVLILTVNMIDMLLNATLVPFTWMLAGAVLGSCERARAARRNKRRGLRTGRTPVIGRKPKTERPIL
ncbi:hypothetical protein [Jhaorihella thermophila]|uniref:O-antigen ligase like membrane protein n=2 Tax=Jhaorihella thermophila TaxID=488547 RepID=A0A1H5TGS3_9RHOB|nr:hypothetical protein [Jhaorihella thermophila]SEF61281.1 hypothetical protein SAMN05421751_102236 [Jhaorihella thermophila]